ncbi:MAG TPA: hypothetical protein VFK05_14460 [Polyangiaceae bacterium]|nr:hypothetical protein [Polyangiaceae bacterium]
MARPLQLGFAGFVFLHFGGQAYRAHTDGALPEPGFERAPWLVAALYLLFWLPFTVFALGQLARTFARGRSNLPEGQERALSVIDPLALALVVLFGGVHGTLMTWPLLSGSLDAADLRAELVADLSSTWRGLPLQASIYLCAVGAAAFCAARSTLALFPAKRPGLSRGVVTLAVLGYVFGSYAVIRCGSGSLLP